MFASDYHEAIFNFSMMLSKEYADASHGTFLQGLEKTCSWLESLAKDLRSKMETMTEEKAAMDLRFNNNQ